MCGGSEDEEGKGGGEAGVLMVGVGVGGGGGREGGVGVVRVGGGGAGLGVGGGEDQGGIDCINLEITTTAGREGGREGGMYEGMTPQTRIIAYAGRHPSYRFVYCYALRTAVSLASNRM